MKIGFFFLFAGFALYSTAGDYPKSNSLHHEKCGTKKHIEYLVSQNPQFAQQLADDENTLQQALANRPDSRLDNTIYTIPVVVHVVYFKAAQNISDAQVQSQIDVLNLDYSRTNVDRSNTPQAFGTIASRTNFQFCLAKRDMNGNATNGIERRQTTVDTFEIDDKMKFFATGGLDAWDVNSYLNIWVCDLGGFILGYSEPPSSFHTNTFGSVIQYNTFGRVGVLRSPYNHGRTCTHELGHCLNLKHTFGDDAQCGPPGDNVYDTPDQDDASYGCLTFPHTDICSPNFPGTMFMNYMDYSDDNCENMFTHYQAVRMETAMNIFYPTLLNSMSCIPVGVEEVSDFQLSIYPNPSTGIISLDMFTTKNLGPELNVRITDLYGKTEYETVILDPAGYKHNLNVKELASGIHYVSFYNEKYKKTERISIVR